MPTLFSEYLLKGLPVKNRIVFPPVVCFHYAGEDGAVTDRNVEHYHQIAAGGAGIIVTEATAVWKDGRLAPFQLGIWSDEHIAGMIRIASAVKAEGAISLLQIHHAGLLTNEQVSAYAKAPSADANNPRSSMLTVNEIAEIIEAFIKAAERAQEAGYQGVEMHGAHGYLLNQFASSLFNKREDEYGGSLEKNMKFATDIILGIRARCGSDFVIGYRLGANSPSLEDGISIAKLLQRAGVDILHVSHGGSLQNLPRTPKGFDYNWIVYSGAMIKTHVGIPVIVVNDIKTPDRALWLIENNHADFVAIGKPQLADPEWANHVKNSEEINLCLSCKPTCKWYEDSRLCPARRRRDA
ncbi:MAG: NADH:flavin oxidoreductase [Bacteroidetes bacterium]|nr:NADH:flavin oxidoreductase [Bacteroidota bacterium]